MHPHPGPENSDHSRGRKERVFGNEVGVDDAYTREPMSSLRAALSTNRNIDDVIEEHRAIKQTTADDGDHIVARVTPAPRRFIQAGNGTI